MKFDYKNCTPEERMKKCIEIANSVDLIGDKLKPFTKELNSLADILRDDEQVLAFTPGTITTLKEQWIMALTNHRIIFVHKGFLEGLLGGIKQEIIDLSNIQTIGSTPGLIFGTIDILHGGKITKMDYVHKTTAQKIINMIQDQLNLMKNTKNTEKEIDKYGEIEKLFQLKEKGIITEDEFNEEKKKILSK